MGVAARQTAEAFPTRLGGRIVPDAMCTLSNDFLEDHLSDGIERVIAGFSQTPGRNHEGPRLSLP